MILFQVRKDQRGFTSSELLIAVLLTSMFAMAFYTAFRGLNAEIARGKVYFDTSLSAKKVMDIMARDVQEAIGVEVARAGENTGTTCLILKLPSIDGTGTPTNISNQFDYVTYKPNPGDSTQLFRSLDVLDSVSSREGGADLNSIVVAKSVNSIAFSYMETALSSVASGTIPTMKYINVQIMARGTTLGTNQELQLDSDLMLKNRLT